MLPKIICIAVLVVCGPVLGYELGDDESSPEYRGEDRDDGFGSYHQDHYEDIDSGRVKRFEAKPKIKTLSPLEIQQVKGAIQQILSGHNQDNPFTPLPSIPALNEERRPETRAIHRPRSAPSQENYRFDAITKFTEDTEVTDATKTKRIMDDALSTDNTIKTSTKFIDYTDVIETTKLKGITDEPLSTDSTLKTSTFTIDEDYNTAPSNDFILGTTNSLSSLPVIPGTDEIKLDMSAATDDISTANDITKTTEMIIYETETNTGLTGATINVLPSTTLPHIGRTDNSDIKSEINNILGRQNEEEITSNTNAAENQEENELIHPETPTRSSGVTLNTMPEITPAADNVDTTHEERQPEDVVENPDLATKESIIATKEEEGSDGDEEEKPTTKSKKRKKTTKQEDSDSDDEETPTTKSKKRKKTTKEEDEEEETTTTTKPKPRGTKRRRTKITTQTTTTKFKLDVPALLAIIANLTYDYEVNLTAKLNQTLMKYSVPTCETPTTTVKRGIFIDYDANATGTIVAKCFVCGLENTGIPRDAHCGDAFAGDFLPLMPMDMTARGRISKFRKYCRYADVPGLLKNTSQPRSVFGRWSGGCSVRWIDLSNVYTQRTCRSRERAIMGRNFASKRMAKLEMALKHTDNGCITSPMATLVPLSRGISLYARFHACVCTGSWCNAADAIPWPGVLLSFVVAWSLCGFGRVGIGQS